MKTLNIRKETQVALSIEHRAYLLKSQHLLIKNAELTKRIKELEIAAKLDKAEIAQNIIDYNHLWKKLN